MAEEWTFRVDLSRVATHAIVKDIVETQKEIARRRAELEDVDPSDLTRRGRASVLEQDLKFVELLCEELVRRMAENAGAALAPRPARVRWSGQMRFGTGLRGLDS